MLAQMPIRTAAVALVLMMKLSLVAAPTTSGKEPIMKARRTTDGQVELTEGDKPVLRYNYSTVEPGDVLARVSQANRIYAKPRSDYIHPLYGVRGEVLTQDWSVDHPHHRGIYWAWPEVEQGGKRGDLHAIQSVFARPTGQLDLQSGAGFAQIKAENHWVWEDGERIVLEKVTIRAYPAETQGRIVDLNFEFLALQDGVTIARRGTDLYGGLNIRMATPKQQNIVTHTDPAGSNPRRAWSGLSGVFEGTGSSGLMLMQHRDNPCYPGDWVQYPELSWCQPTFPAAKTRYRLSRTEPLVLRFRLWTHSGGTPEGVNATELWDRFNGAGPE